MVTKRAAYSVWLMSNKTLMFSHTTTHYRGRRPSKNATNRNYSD
ncbi:hypothetical protein Nizo1839_1519 [Lactiplantibacillus plantarum]|nr:hypothetical protein SF2A35B_0002 [Lactiplantibacillus plantarum]KZT80751.1 hypothetical protein Nizo1839_1519 [Lactiplantibacillus plantarum]KZU11056.1 hypothetical protein Nizo2264_2813 [Lactiplantibacillus plantarum]